MNTIYKLFGWATSNNIPNPAFGYGLQEHLSDQIKSRKIQQYSDSSFKTNHESIHDSIAMDNSNISFRKVAESDSNRKREDDIGISLDSGQSSIRKTDEDKEGSDSLRYLRDSDRKRKAIWRARGHYAMFCLENGSTEDQQRLFSEFVVKHKNDGLMMAKDFYDARRDFSNLKDNIVREELLENLNFAAGRKRGRYKKCNRVNERETESDFEKTSISSASSSGLQLAIALEGNGKKADTAT